MLWRILYCKNNWVAGKLDDGGCAGESSAGVNRGLEVVVGGGVCYYRHGGNDCGDTCVAFPRS